MNSPNPVTSQPGFRPSGSTLGTGLGGSIALVVIAALGGFHVTVSPELASAITVICAAFAGYLPSSGRSS